MNFTEVVDLVLSVTGRPDKIVEAQNAVNTILHLAVLKASFSRDLVEVTTLLNAGEIYSGTIDLTKYSNFRKIKYIRPTTLAKCLTFKQPEGMFSNHQVLRNTYYIAGTNLNWVIGVGTPSMEIGYYVFPPRLSDASPNHWILDVAPGCIIDLAIARVFKSIGDNAASQQYEGSGAQLYIAFRNDQESQHLTQAQ